MAEPIGERDNSDKGDRPVGPRRAQEPKDPRRRANLGRRRSHSDRVHFAPPQNIDWLQANTQELDSGPEPVDIAKLSDPGRHDSIMRNTVGLVYDGTCTPCNAAPARH